MYTPSVDTYIASLVSRVKAAHKESKFLEDRLLDEVGTLSQMFEHIQRLLTETGPGSSVALTYAQLNVLSSMTANSIRLIGNVLL